MNEWVADQIKILGLTSMYKESSEKFSGADGCPICFEKFEIFAPKTAIFSYFFGNFLEKKGGGVAGGYHMA